MVSPDRRTYELKRLEPRLPGPVAGIDSGTGYEALLGLMMVAGHEPPGEYAVGAGWFRDVRARASKALLEDVTRLCAGVPTVFGHLLGLVRQAAEPRDLAALIDLVGSLPPERLRSELLGFSASTVRAAVPGVVLDRAAAGDPAATRELLAAAATDACWQENLRALLVLTPQQAKDLTIRVLSAWSEEVFADQEPELGPRLEQQAARWRSLAARVGWPALVEQATSGIVLGDGLAVNAVLLVPTVLGAPWVYTSDLYGTKILCCPVQEHSETSSEHLVPVLRALADETRLALLRRLGTAGPATLTELTAHVGLAKSTVHKHVMLLRAAGLVRVALPERTYAVRQVPDLTALLTEYIGTGP